MISFLLDQARYSEERNGAVWDGNRVKSIYSIFHLGVVVMSTYSFLIGWLIEIVF